MSGGGHGIKIARRIRYNYHEDGKMVKPDLSHVHPQPNRTPVQGPIGPHEQTRPISEHCCHQGMTALIQATFQVSTRLPDPSQAASSV